MRSDIHCPVLFSPFCVSFCVCDVYVFGVYVSPVHLQLRAGSCSDVEVSPVVGFAKWTALLPDWMLVVAGFSSGQEYCSSVFQKRQSALCRAGHCHIMVPMLFSPRHQIFKKMNTLGPQVSPWAVNSYRSYLCYSAADPGHWCLSQGWVLTIFHFAIHLLLRWMQ